MPRLETLVDESKAKEIRDRFQRDFPHYPVPDLIHQMCIGSMTKREAKQLARILSNSLRNTRVENVCERLAAAKAEKQMMEEDGHQHPDEPLAHNYKILRPVFRLPENMPVYHCMGFVYRALLILSR